MSDAGAPAKKRNRVSLLCDQCRKRKVKCDRKIPCLSCVKHKTVEQCDYTGDQLGSEIEYGGNISVFRTFQDPKISAQAVASKNSTTNNHTTNNHSLLGPHLWQTSTASSTLSGMNSTATKVTPTSHPTTDGYNLHNTVLSELEMLKYKLHQLESSLGNGQSSLDGSMTQSGQPILGQLHPLQVGNYQQQHHPPQSQNNLAQPILHHNQNLQHYQNQLRQQPLVSPPRASLEESTEILPPINVSAPKANQVTFLGINPHDVANPNETLDIYDGYSPIHLGSHGKRMNFGPFSWLSFIKKDEASQQVWSFIVLRRKDFARTIPVLPKDATTSKYGFAKLVNEQDHEEVFRKQAMFRASDNDAEPFDQGALLNHKMKIALNKHAIALGLTVFEGELDQKLHLIERIRIMLPTHQSLWVLVNRFFKVVYPYIPLLDEASFRQEVKRIVGPEEYHEEKFEQLHIEKRGDFATLGILLIMLRLSYLSTLSNNKEVNERVLASDDAELAEMRFILSNPVNIDVANLAQLCLDQFDLQRRSSITVLQCAVFMRLYQTYSPEEGDGADGGDNLGFTSMCIQSAYCMGLNREPSKFDETAVLGKESNIGRKLWYFMRTIDMTQSIHFGFPLMIYDDYSDVRLPFYEPGNSNVMDADMEKHVCETYRLMDSLHIQLRNILEQSLLVKNRIKMADMTALLTDLEKETDAKLGSFLDYTETELQAACPARKVIKCKLYITIKFFLMSVFHHFFLNYEKTGKNELAYFYLRKYMVVSCELMTEFLGLIQDSQRMFGRTSTIPDLMLTPSMELVIHKTNQINFAILVRLNNAIYALKSDVEAHDKNLLISFEYKLHFARLCKLAKVIHKFCKYGVACLSKLSTRYYYAWRQRKAHSFILDAMSTTDFQEHVGSQNWKSIMFTLEQLSELLVIADAALLKMKASAQQEGKDQPTDADRSPTAMTPGQEPTPLDTGRTEDVPANPLQLWDRLSFSKGLSLDLDDFQLGDTEEIDSLWLQLGSLKNDIIKSGPPNTGQVHAEDAFLENQSYLLQMDFGFTQFAMENALNLFPDYPQWDEALTN